MGSLVYAYGGYLHTVPRLISLAFVPLPLEAYGTYAVLAAGALTGLLGGFVYAAAAEISGSPRLALIPVLAMALAPALAVESLGNLANLHWFLVFAAFWALLVQPGPRLRSHRPPSRWRRA